MLSILLYRCESSALTADLDKRIQAFERQCYRRLLLLISWVEHNKTNEYARNQVAVLARLQEQQLAVVKRRKLSWLGHVTRHNTLSKTILQGTIEGGRCRGRQRKSWTEDVTKRWTRLDMTRTAYGDGGQGRGGGDCLQ